MVTAGSTWYIVIIPADEKQRSRERKNDLVNCRHTGRNVVIDMAMKKPSSWIVWAHVSHNSGAGLHLELINILSGDT